MRATGYLRDAVAWALGETLAWGIERRSTPAATVGAWMDSGTHRRVLLNRRYRELGIGVEHGTPLAPSLDSAATFVAEFGFVEP